jgi:hypothetical protein
VADMTKSEAVELLAKAESVRLERNRKLREWRAEHRAEYNAYYKDWQTKRDAKLAEAKRILGQ